MWMIDPLINFPATQYYFDTFIVGAHHSVPHLIADLLHRKSLIDEYLSASVVLNNKLAKLKKLICAKLDTLNLADVDQLEEAEPIYWVNELGRRSAIEISTYGRIRPETMELLICMTEEDYETTMTIAGKLSRDIQKLGDVSLNNQTDVPKNMPRT